MSRHPGAKGHDTSAERVSEAFKDLGQRSTMPRRVIEEKLKGLARDGRSFTAEDLWQSVRDENRSIGRATVFRAVERLVGMELLGRVEFPDGKHRYFVCGDSRHHHHLACTRCHRVTKFEYCLSPDTIEAIGKQEHFAIEGHSLTLFGLCESCQQ